MVVEENRSINPAKNSLNFKGWYWERDKSNSSLPAGHFAAKTWMKWITWEGKRGQNSALQRSFPCWLMLMRVAAGKKFDLTIFRFLFCFLFFSPLIPGLLSQGGGSRPSPCLLPSRLPTAEHRAARNGCHSFPHHTEDNLRGQPMQLKKGQQHFKALLTLSWEYHGSIVSYISIPWHYLIHAVSTLHVL